MSKIFYEQLLWMKVLYEIFAFELFDCGQGFASHHHYHKLRTPEITDGCWCWHIWRKCLTAKEFIPFRLLTFLSPSYKTDFDRIRQKFATICFRVQFICYHLNSRQAPTNNFWQIKFLIALTPCRGFLQRHYSK